MPTTTQCCTRDWFLEQVIEAARQLNVPATVTFVPDHGESLPDLDDEAAGHGGPDFYPSQYEIPAFVWVNDAYRAAHPQRVAILKANVARQVRSHEFFYTVADLMGITWPDAKPERSFASPSFVPDTGQYLVGGVLKAIPETSVNTRSGTLEPSRDDHCEPAYEERADWRSHRPASQYRGVLGRQARSGSAPAPEIPLRNWQ